MKTRTAIALLSALVAMHSPAGAQTENDYPRTPIRLVVNNAPGGPTDLVARVIAQSTTEITGKAVIVENRAGAGGVIGTDYVAKSPPDGYTLSLCSAGPMAINPYLMSMPYVPLRDLQPISDVVHIPYLLLVRQDSPFKTLKDLLAYARANPGKLNYGSAGAGTTSHLAAAMLAGRAKIEITHIPYKGNTLANTDLMAGVLDMGFDAVPSAAAQLRAGKLRALAITDSNRLDLFPDVPTFAEEGIPDFDISTWLGICAPAATPKNIVQQLNRILVAGANAPKSKHTYKEFGGIVIANSPDQFRAFIAGEQTKWEQVIRAIGLKTQ